MKSLIRKLLKFFGYRMNKYNTNTIVIYPNEFTPIKNNDENYNLYRIGLERSENVGSDNFRKQMRFYSLIQVTKYILKSNNSYDFAECGCWKGHSTYLISKLIKESKKKISFYIFDSFEGLSKPSTEDKEYFYKNEKEKEKIAKQFSTTENFVKNRVLNDFNFAKIYKGMIPDRFKEVDNIKFSLVHIDVTLYKPTLSSLEFFFPRIVKGGVLICDDYNSSSLPGAKEAWDEYFKNEDYRFFYQVPLGGCFIIK